MGALSLPPTGLAGKREPPRREGKKKKLLCMPEKCRFAVIQPAKDCLQARQGSLGQPASWEPEMNLRPQSFLASPESKRRVNNLFYSYCIFIYNFVRWTQTIAVFHLKLWRSCWCTLNKRILIISSVWDTNMTAMSIAFCVSWDCVKTKNMQWRK